MGQRFVPGLVRVLCACAVLCLVGPTVRGQDEALEAPVNVGYIDGAIPRSMLRFRFDDAYDDPRPTRAEFFYAKGGIPGSPGPPLPEARVDYQDHNTYLEWAFVPSFSAFIEGGLRAVNPLFNENEFGFGDLNAGFKWAFFTTKDLTTTFQLRTWFPTGAASRGLGTHHVTVEPALLFNQRLNDFLLLEGELRYWVPIGGTDFAGDIVRYGVGLSYAPQERESLWFSPVVELVGWTVLDGKQLAAFSPTDFRVESASGITIVNLKAGLRVGFEDYGDLYVGYGLALTDNVWYRNILRVELRWFF
jgi:hypothetical protein